MTVIPIVIDAFGTIPKGLIKTTGRVGNRMIFQDHPKYNIVEIDQNTENCPGDLRRLAITQTPVKDHQLTLVGKHSQ